jgi:hypothetical protein
MNVIPEGDHPSPRAEAELDTARRRFVQNKIDAGWRLHNGWTAYPQNTEMGFFIDPKSGRLAFSPRLVAQVKLDGTAAEMFELIRRIGEQTQRGGES